MHALERLDMANIANIANTIRVELIEPKHELDSCLLQVKPSIALHRTVFT